MRPERSSRSLDTEFSYDIVYTVTDQFRSVSYNDYVSTAIYLMHFLHGGKGVAFGQKATMEDWVDFNFKTLFRKLASFLGSVKFGSADVDRVIINDTTKASPVMVDSDGAGTLYPVVTSKTIGTAASQAVANNLTTTAAGSVLDARQGKILDDKIPTGAAASKAVANNLTTASAGTAVLDAYQGKIVNDKITNLGVSSSATGAVGSSFSAANYKYCYLKKVGKMVFMSMGLGYNTASETIPTGTTLFTIPAGYRPAAETILIAQFTRKATTSSLNTSSIGAMKLTTAGLLTQSHSGSTYCIYCFGMWETA